jgi:hypothetical protein
MGLAALGISAAGGLAGMLFGDKGEYSMSPEQRKIYEKLLAEYESGDYGYSQADLGAMKERLRGSLLEESGRATSRNMASLGRRRMASPGQMAGMATNISSAYGKAYGEGMTDIDIAGAESKLRGKSQLRAALLGSSQGDFTPPDQSIWGDIGSASGNWMEYFLRKKKPKYSGGYYSDPQFGMR